jgi:hypothetical protein
MSALLQIMAIDGFIELSPLVLHAALGDIIVTMQSENNRPIKSTNFNVVTNCSYLCVQLIDRK